MQHELSKLSHVLTASVVVGLLCLVNCRSVNVNSACELLLEPNALSVTILSGVSSFWVEHLKDGLDLALRELCDVLGPCCQSQQILPDAESDVSGVHHNEAWVHYKVLGRNNSTLNVLWTRQHHAHRRSWFAHGMDDDEKAAFQFLHECQVHANLGPLMWPACATLADWEVVGCKDLMQSGVLQVLKEQGYAPQPKDIKCNIIEAVDDPLRVVSLALGHQKGSTNALPESSEHAVRAAVDVLAWRMYWMSAWVSKSYSTLRLAVNDFRQPHASRVVAILTQFLGIKKMPPSIVKTLLNAISVALDGHASRIQKASANVEAEALTWIAERLPVASVFMAADWPDQQLLARVAVDGKIILTQVNCGYLDFADNWIEGMEGAAVTNFLLIAEDTIAHKYLVNRVGEEHVLLAPTGARRFSSSKSLTAAFKYIDSEFNLLTEKRSYVLEAILKRGFGVLWMDIDTFIMENPLDYIPAGAVMGIQDDFVAWCTGLLYLAPCWETVNAMQEWGRRYDIVRTANNESGVHDQPSFNWANGAFISTNIARQSVKVFVFPPHKFPNGRLRFGTTFPEYNASLWQQHHPVFVHANWIVGHDEKKQALRDNGYWRNPMSDADYPRCDTSRKLNAMETGH